jgi:hypothetical protein
MDVPSARHPRNAARSARHERSVVAVPSERRLSPRSDRSLGDSRADRRTGLAACKPMHQHWRSARRGASWAGRLTGRPRYSARRAKVGFSIRRRMRGQPGGESGWRCCLGMEPSVRAAGTHGARLGGSHHGLGNGGCCEVGEPARVLFDAAARDDQHKIPTGPCGGPTAEAAERRLGAHPYWNSWQGRVGQAGLPFRGEWVQPGCALVLLDHKSEYHGTLDR